MLQFSRDQSGGGAWLEEWDVQCPEKGQAGLHVGAQEGGEPGEKMRGGLVSFWFLEEGGGIV